MCVAATIASFTVVACSSSDSPAPTSDAGTGSDSATDTDGGATDSSTVADSGGDTGPAAVNGCAAADFAASDHTADADARKITFPSGESAGPYSPKCMTVKAGQSVTWSDGSFVNHPLDAIGGDSASPIASTETGTTVTFKFATAGTFGYGCTIHSSMRGAILVVP